MCSKLTTIQTADETAKYFIFKQLWKLRKNIHEFAFRRERVVGNVGHERIPWNDVDWMDYELIQSSKKDRSLSEENSQASEYLSSRSFEKDSKKEHFLPHKPFKLLLKLLGIFKASFQFFSRFHESSEQS